MVPVRRVGLVDRAPRHRLRPGGAARGTRRPRRPPVDPGHGRPRRARRRPGRWCAGGTAPRPRLGVLDARTGEVRAARTSRASPSTSSRPSTASWPCAAAWPTGCPRSCAARSARPPAGAGQRRRHSTLDPADVSPAQAWSWTDTDGLTVHGLLHQPRARRRRGARGRAAAPDRHGARRPDQPHRGVLRHLDAVLDDPRLRGAARQLLGQHRLRARLPRAAARPLGPARHRRLRHRGDLAGARRPRRPDPARHPRRQRRRVRRAAGDDDQPRLRGRHQPVRRRRPGGAGRRDAQVRVALPRPAGRALAGGRGRLPRALADPPRRPAARRAAPAPGRRRHGRAAGAGPRHGRGDAGGRPRGRARASTRARGTGSAGPSRSSTP